MDLVGSVNILICEDSAFLRSRIRMALQELPYVGEIQEAEDSVTALEFIRSRPVTFVILDLHLRLSSGFDVLDGVSRFELPPKLLVFTNSEDSRVRERCLSAGASGFFDKASGIDPLVKRLESLARGVDAT